MEDARAPVDVYHVGQGRCLVWDASGAERLRREHRLVGCLLGSFPHHKQQNLFHTLPFLLMPEEVSVALKRGWIRLLDDSVPYAEPLESDKAAHERHKREAQAQREKERAEHRAKEIRYWEQRTNTNTAANDKRKKRKIDDEKDDTAVEEEATSAHVQESVHSDLARHASASTPASAPAPPAPTEGGGGGMALRAEDVGGAPWRREERAIEWDEWQRCVFPRDDLHAAQRQAVFEDLWLRPSCYVSSGGKFGGDFLVYPGDPLMFHASYIVVVVGWEDPLPPLDMVAVGRVAVGVKKATVFASVVRTSSDDSTRVRYVTIDWRGVT